MRLSALALPLVMMPALLLGGCSSDEKKATPAGGTYLSTTAGASFEQSVQAPDTEDANIALYDLGRIHRALQDPNTIVIAAGGSGIVVSYDDGVTWKNIPIPGMQAAIDVVLLPSGIFIATGVDSVGQGVASRSLDSGKSWQNVFTIPLPDKKPGIQILKGPTAPPATVVALEIDPKHPDRIWAGTNDGTILLAEQSGKTWRKVVEVASPTSAVTGDRQGAGIIRLIASPVNGSDLTIVTKDKRLLEFKDNKVREVKVPESISVPTSFGLALGSRKVLNAILIPGFPDAFLIGSSDGAVVTRDKGKSYLPLQLPIDASKTFTSMGLAVSPKNVNRILIAIDGIVYRSEDSGTTWNTTDLPDRQAGLGTTGLRITDMSINPNNPARVLVIAKQSQS